MIHANGIFGKSRKQSAEELENIIETYLGELFHTGQLCGEYSHTWINKTLTAQYGRGICRRIEKNTGIPTYYYLTRYRGRKKGEDKRNCPGCGRNWRTGQSTDSIEDFWKFSFQCKKCRLVSHVADSYDNERYAAIGEFKKRGRRP